MDAREKLIVDALRFAVWAAGEGISPIDGAPEPETFLFDYATVTGDEDYDTLPDRILVDRALIHRDENHGPTLERAAERDENPPKIAVLPNGTGVCIGGRWNGWQFRKHPGGSWISEMPLEMVDPMEGSPLSTVIRAMGEKKNG